MSWWDTHEEVPTRASLLGRLKDKADNASWQEFFSKYWRLIYGYARKAGLSDAEAQDVVQEVLLTVCNKIGEFRYDPSKGKFKGWLLQTTKWRVNDQFRKRRPDEVHLDGPPDDPRATDPIERLPDPHRGELDTAWDEEWARNLVTTALDRIRGSVRAKHYQLYDAHVIKGWPVQQVAETLGVSRMEVYLAKHRVGRLLRDEIRRLEKEIA